MPDPIADYNTAADGFAAVLEKTEDLDRQSPCAEWKGKDVVDHVFGGTAYFTELFGGTAPEVGDDVDLPTRYAKLRAAFVEACEAPGALEKLVPSPIGGEIPAALMLGIYTSDTLIHTWDLARANGADVELDPELLRRSWENVIPMNEVLRSDNLFGPKLDVAEDAPMQTKALAFFGRAT